MAPPSHGAAGLEEAPSQRETARHAAPRKDVRPLVLAMLQAEWRATAKLPQPCYVSVDSLRPPCDIELNDTAIMLAALSGWRRVGGNAPHSVHHLEPG